MSEEQKGWDRHRAWPGDHVSTMGMMWVEAWLRYGRCLHGALWGDGVHSAHISWHCAMSLVSLAWQMTPVAMLSWALWSSACVPDTLLLT